MYSTVDRQFQQEIPNELNIVIRENTCPHLLQFYGAILHEQNLWICMELMDTSLSRFYIFVYHKLHHCIPEIVLAYITLAVRIFFSTIFN
jgi:hypothetical protein